MSSLYQDELGELIDQMRTEQSGDFVGSTFDNLGFSTINTARLGEISDKQFLDRYAKARAKGGFRLLNINTVISWFLTMYNARTAKRNWERASKMMIGDATGQGILQVPLRTGPCGSPDLVERAAKQIMLKKKLIRHIFEL